MRNKFVQLLVEWGHQDPDLYLLTGDLGFSVLEPFAEAFPQRFINVGVAEQNMIGIASGLAKLGKTVFVYSIVNFATLRCLEQIRNDVCYHNGNVVITVVGGGFAYGTHGYTHLGVEDIAALMPLPNMKIFSPADAFELMGCMDYIKAQRGPCYLRMARGGEVNLHAKKIDFATELLPVPHAKINLISHGTVLIELLQAQKILLQEYAIQVGVYSLPLLKPLMQSKLLTILQYSEYIFVYEEHMRIGGLGSQLAQLSGILKASPVIHCVGADDKIMHLTGDQHYIRTLLGLDAASIVKQVVNQWQSSYAPKAYQHISE